MTTIRPVGAEAAPALLKIVRAAFSTRPVLDPPADALRDTEESLAKALANGGGLVASYDVSAGPENDRDVGALVLDPQGSTLWLRRVGVLPEVRDHGVATMLVEEALARAEGYDEVAVLAREELPRTSRFWREHGFVPVGAARPYVELRRPAPRTYDAPDADSMREIGATLAARLRPGDVVVLAGELGAGKTTFTQGLGAGLEVRGDVTSPTFVISRVHPALGDGPPLVHVDGFRLGGVAELDDLDLDTSLDEAVTVIEWGEGIAEGLADDRVEVRIDRALADDAARQDGLDPRRVRIAPVGRRWLGTPGSSA
ncbi:MAG TPA: tRNA (adenosine(37)-N6)-threonylcarbamoyltransferase complex ATPase subunit type 1 TsaE [Nocardioides sp.]|uniref:tRNA (adenosine(37)-N6)-threonylcarbamoyltransferase complex ATPase subunit type 1 TsaE n=1 Tax=Nocardioides sp. TaxID=35761 RepID=UPI002F421F05